MAARDRGTAQGPLAGVRVIELVGQGPAPYGAMLLADLGADVVRVDSPAAAENAKANQRNEIVARGRRSIAIDLKSPGGVKLLLDLVDRSDAILDPFRPGTTERLGIGPDLCLARRPSLVYGRATGWGQTGPLAAHAGHDINFVALAGALAHIGRAGQAPVPPLNLVGDMGGGGLFLAFGVVCALLEATRSGRGQIVDAAMIDGVASLMTIVHGFYAQGFFSPGLGTNTIDSGAPFYEVYECADGKYVSVGPIERKFYDRLLAALGLAPGDLPPRGQRETWPASKGRLAEVFKQRTRAAWCELLEPNPEICFAPVLDMLEAPDHPHHRERGTFMVEEGNIQAAPAPRFSRTPGAVQRPPSLPGADTNEVLRDWLSVDPATLLELRSQRVIA